MPLLVFDILILAVLAFFTWRGAKKGLILTLCGFAGIILAFLGARLVSEAFYRPVSNILQPGVYQTILGAQPEDGAPESSQPPSSGNQGEDPQPAPSYSLEELIQSIQEAGLFSGLASFLDQASDWQQLQTSPAPSPAQALSSYLAQLIAKAGLFVLSFLLILLVWFLAGHLLDLAFQLPILSAVNLAGGALIGLVKAALIVIVLVWVGQLAGWIPTDPDTPVLSLFTLQGIRQLLNGLLA